MVLPATITGEGLESFECWESLEPHHRARSTSTNGEDAGRAANFRFPATWIFSGGAPSSWNRLASSELCTNKASGQANTRRHRNRLARYRGYIRFEIRPFASSSTAPKRFVSRKKLGQSSVSSTTTACGLILRRNRRQIKG